MKHIFTDQPVTPWAGMKELAETRGRPCDLETFVQETTDTCEQLQTKFRDKLRNYLT